LILQIVPEMCEKVSIPLPGKMDLTLYSAVFIGYDKRWPTKYSEYLLLSMNLFDCLKWGGILLVLLKENWRLLFPLIEGICTFGI